MARFQFRRLKEFTVNSSGGRIYVDKVVERWLLSFRAEKSTTRTSSEKSLYCQITKEGLGDNTTSSQPDNSQIPKISLVVVLFDSIKWVDSLNAMFAILEPWLHEIIVVDNGSLDGGLGKIINENQKTIKVVLDSVHSFSAAVNRGVDFATGDAFLFINPDVWITQSALWALISAYISFSDAAVFMPKLLLMKTPGFINSVGNHVPFFRWGYDQGLGHLDMGQFDHLQEIEAACFATVLIPRYHWEIVGPLDEGYAMYYEDSDWSFRAREKGFTIRFVHQAEVFHDFGGNSGDHLISPRKLENVTFSRLRFSRKNYTRVINFFTISSYFLFDLLFYLYLFVKGRDCQVHRQAIRAAWKKFRSEKPGTKIRKTSDGMSGSFGGINLSPHIHAGKPLLVNNHLKDLMKLG